MTFHELVQVWFPAAKKIKQTDQEQQVLVIKEAIGRALNGRE